MTGEAQDALQQAAQDTNVRVVVLTGARAFQIMVTGDKVTAHQALEWGMLHQVIPSEQFESMVSEWAERLANAPTRAIGLTKRAFNKAMDNTLNQTMLARCSYGPYSRAMLRICMEESFHKKQGQEMVIRYAQGTPKQKAMVQTDTQ